MNKLLTIAFAVTAMAVIVPTAHAEDAYIESDGTQVINTGYYINAKTKIEIDFQMTEITSQGRGKPHDCMGEAQTRELC